MENNHANETDLVFVFCFVFGMHLKIGWSKNVEKRFHFTNADNFVLLSNMRLKTVYQGAIN